MVWPACSPAHLGPLALSVLALLAFSSGLHLSALIGVANRLPRQYRGAILLGMVSEKTGKPNHLVSSVADPDSDPVGSETFCRNLIRKKSFQIRIRAARIRSENKNKTSLIKFTISPPNAQLK
jgi:hypothetical protein